MKVSGITFIRNAIQYDYPIREAIESILPVCDEFIVCLGNSDDETESLILSIPTDKLRIIHSIWDDSLRQGGAVLAVETNKALDAVSNDSDWVFYIQGDEVFHEDGLEEIYQAMKRWKDVPEVEGLLVKYLHFYGSYHYIGDSPRWYRNEIRVIRNDKSIRSWKDAQGFRKNGRKLTVKSTNTWMHHYGWVKNPVYQKRKEKNFHRYWHPDEWIKRNVKEEELFNYYQIDSLAPFKGKHPKVMDNRIASMNWQFEYHPSMAKLSFKNKILRFIEKTTGWRPFEYKNYRLI
ncbi:MAG: glycosyltransferase family 2 protein [Bacteroidia bacterium]|nr:glycosyltransferase family 2 protein [Bacteroidia bacterium]